MATFSREAVAGQLVGIVLHAEGQVVCLEIVAGDHQAGLKYTALVHFPLFVPAFVPFVTVVEIRMYAGSYAEQFFRL